MLELYLKHYGKAYRLNNYQSCGILIKIGKFRDKELTFFRLLLIRFFLITCIFLILIPVTLTFEKIGRTLEGWNNLEVQTGGGGVTKLIPGDTKIVSNNMERGNSISPRDSHMLSKSSTKDWESWLSRPGEERKESLHKLHLYNFTSSLI